MHDIEVGLKATTTTISFRPYVPAPGDIVVTDSNLAPRLSEHQPIIVPAGEKSKNLAEYAAVLDQLAQRGAKRKNRLVAIGGGVIGDLAGFAAATYMRGIPFVQVPTTLLSMVDSSVGGKVGVDTVQGKNLVGAFYPAHEVYIDATWLKTLDTRQWQCGMAEVLKYGFIMSEELAVSLENNPMLDVVDLRANEMIRTCIELKRQVVEADEFETTGYRAILNFGHTVGHAIERLTNYETYTHGEAISVGMVVETKIGEKLGITPTGLSTRLINTLSAHGLPVNSPTTAEVENIIQSMRGDKKSVQGELSMSLLTGLGKCKLTQDVDESVVREVLSEN
jgi:3-dehydroquinate synthase